MYPSPREGGPHAQMSDAHVPDKGERSWWNRLDLALIGLLFGALVLRVLWVLFLHGPTTKTYPDMIAYDRMARLFLDSGTIAFKQPHVPTAFYMPGYPLFVAAVYWLVGSFFDQQVAVHVVQAVLSVVTLFIVYRIGLRVCNRKVALVAVAMGALYPPFAMANNVILTEMLFTLALCLLALAAVRLLDTPSWRGAALFGALLALCCYIRPVAVLWGVVPFLFLLRKVPLRRLALLGGLGLVVFALVMSPWWVRNAKVFDRFVVFNTSSANPLLVGTYYGLPGGKGIPSRVFDLWASSPQEELTMNAEWQSWALQRLRDQLKTQPMNVVKQRYQLTKTALTWPFDLIIWQIPRWAKTASIAAQEILTILALIGFAFNYRNSRSWLLFSLFAYFVVAHAVILILNRYLFPLMPVILLLAAYGALTLLERVRELSSFLASKVPCG